MSCAFISIYTNRLPIRIIHIKLKQPPILKYGLGKNNIQDKYLKTGPTKQLFIYLITLDAIKRSITDIRVKCA
jgi:hypothetical protein